MYAQAAVLGVQFQYRDGDIGLVTEATTIHYYGEWGLEGNAGRGWNWLLFVPLQYAELRSSGARPDQVRSAVAGSVRKGLLRNRLSVTASGRAEHIDGRLIALPGLGAEFGVSPSISLRTSLQRSYRAPTLNERFYEPGGNPDLKPENGWSLEAGGSYSGQILDRVHMSHSLTAYDRKVRDWIIWLGGAIWTPHNLAAVHSRGLETEHTLTGSNGKVGWRMGATFGYSRSTPTESYLANDNSIGKQIPYTPEWTASGTGVLSWNGASLTYLHSFASTRYITADESAALDPYSTGNLLLSYTSTRFRPRIIVNAAIQNIWNSRYSVVAFRPMPGINYLISISLQLE